MAEILNMPNESKPVTKEDISNIHKVMEKITTNTESDKNMMDSIAEVLALPDDQFEIVAPGVLQAYRQTLNNPNDKIALTQALNATGYKAEDLTESFGQLFEEIDKMELTFTKRDFLKNLFSIIANAINETEGIAKRTINIPIELCNPSARIPQYAHISDSGLDIYALDDITIKPGETVLVPTGIKVAIPSGYELQIRPKSGRALKTKLRIANTPGTIDSGYRDEIKVIIENVDPPIKDITYEEKIDGDKITLEVTSILFGSSYTIGKGEKFAQLVLAETPKVAFYRAESVDVFDGNREGGFGSTGLK